MNPKITYQQLEEELQFHVSHDTYYQILCRHNETNWLAKKKNAHI